MLVGFRPFDDVIEHNISVNILEGPMSNLGFPSLSGRTRKINTRLRSCLVFEDYFPVSIILLGKNSANWQQYVFTGDIYVYQIDDFYI